MLVLVTEAFVGGGRSVCDTLPIYAPAVEFVVRGQQFVVMTQPSYRSQLPRCENLSYIPRFVVLAYNRVTL